MLRGREACAILHVGIVALPSLCLVVVFVVALPHFFSLSRERHSSTRQGAIRIASSLSSFVPIHGFYSYN